MTTTARNTNSIVFDLIALTKPRVNFLIIFTAIVGMLLAQDYSLNYYLMLYASIGIYLAASAAAVQVFFSEYFPQLPDLPGELSKSVWHSFHEACFLRNQQYHQKYPNCIHLKYRTSLDPSPFSACSTPAPTDTDFAPVKHLMN